MSRYKRILICGTSSCAGKNWFGERLSKKTGFKFYDTDDMAWVKRFTVQRDYKEKCKMLKDVAKKDKWIIATGATSYVEPAEKRADLIIVLKIGFLRSSYRMIRRNRKHEKSGKEKSLHSSFGLVGLNYKHHCGKIGNAKHIEMLIKKYPKKIMVMTQKEKNKFLECIE
jgi:adenylate kinase family enzyme